MNWIGLSLSFFTAATILSGDRARRRSSRPSRPCRPPGPRCCLHRPVSMETFPCTGKDMDFAVVRRGVGSAAGLRRPGGRLQFRGRGRFGRFLDRSVCRAVPHTSSSVRRAWPEKESVLFGEFARRTDAGPRSSSLPGLSLRPRICSPSSHAYCQASGSLILRPSV